MRTCHIDGPPRPLIAGVQPSGSEPSSTSGDANTLCNVSAATGTAIAQVMTAASKAFIMVEQSEHSAPSPTRTLL